MPGMQTTRRHLVFALGAAAACIGLPALASSRRSVLPSMTDGPFYPPRAWRSGGGAGHLDWDADLTRVQRGAQVLVASGEHLGLALEVADANGRIVDAAEVEIWQCDALRAYHHPDVRLPAAQIDAGFQGFGLARGDSRGAVGFRTIKPVPYPGRTPHIHVKVRHVSFGEWTSQLFLADDPGNARDFLWRQVDAAGQAALSMRLQASSDAGLKWQARHLLVVPA
jgi:protocatechuate 3,4-dioxygenase, beta subunit